VLVKITFQNFSFFHTKPEASERFGDKNVHVQENAAILFQHVELGVDVALCLLHSNFALEKTRELRLQTQTALSGSRSGKMMPIRQIKIRIHNTEYLCYVLAHLSAITEVAGVFFFPPIVPH
jgi:hypothetical protein